MRRRVSLYLSIAGLMLITAACDASPAAVDLPTAVPAASLAPAPTEALPTVTPAPSPVPPTDTAPAATVAPATAAPNVIASATAPAALPAGTPIAHLSAGQPVTITALHMLDANTGWAVAQVSADLDSRILQTADGAKTWLDVTPPEPASLPDPNQSAGKNAAAFFLNAQEAWVAFG
jgi:hypothetical protein